MSDRRDEWIEADSVQYRELANVAVPARDEQIATLVALLPFAPQEAFRVVEVGCGEGVLSYAILDCFPRASVTALDGSPSMVAYAAQLLHRFGARASVFPFSLATSEWLSPVDSADCLVSSLCLHHLSAAEKRRLFIEVYSRLSARGALLIADLIEPQREEARALFAASWDRLAEAQSQIGSPQLFEKFVKEKWNYYRFPDSVDRPSPLYEQLLWLREAGFTIADCFWLQAGHAIYGGYKTSVNTSSQNVAFATALRAAQEALHAVR